MLPITTIIITIAGIISLRYCSMLKFKVISNAPWYKQKYQYWYDEATVKSAVECDIACGFEASYKPIKRKFWILWELK